MRTAAMNQRIFGAAAWIQPHGGRAYVMETDHYVGILIELANAAVIRCRQTKASRPQALKLVAQ
jgi:hypothetical protein